MPSLSWLSGCSASRRPGTGPGSARAPSLLLRLCVTPTAAPTAARSHHRFCCYLHPKRSRSLHPSFSPNRNPGLSGRTHNTEHHCLPGGQQLHQLQLHLQLQPNRAFETLSACRSFARTSTSTASSPSTQQRRSLQTQHRNNYPTTKLPFYSSHQLFRTRTRSFLNSIIMSQTRSNGGGGGGGHSHSHGHSHGLFSGHHHHHDNAYLTSQNKNDAGVRITRIGLYSNLGMAIAKGAGGYAFNSQSMVADAWHSLTDLASDILTLATVSWSLRPPTKSFPLGFGKVESLGSLGVSSMLLFGGVFMCINSCQSLYAHFLLDPDAAAALLEHSHGHSHGHHHGVGAEGPSLHAAWLAAGTVAIKEWLYHASMSSLSLSVNSTHPFWGLSQ